MDLSAFVVVVLMWIVTYTGMGATCGFTKASDLCDLYSISLETLVFTILIIITSVVIVAFGAKLANDKWDKKIDMVSAFAVSFVLFWVAYGMIARYFLIDFLF